MTTGNPGETPLLQMRGIRKAFPGVLAVGRGSFELQPGEIHALVGENGAGKSTLIKVLTGAHQADDGEIILYGERVTFTSPLAARRAGIATIYQEFTLVPTLSVGANLFLGREQTRRGLIDSRRERRDALDLFRNLEVAIEPDVEVRYLSVAQQQLVEIGRALATEARVLVMDEPTAALTPNEVNRLFVLLRGLASRGIGIVFIGHRLDEVFHDRRPDNRHARRGDYCHVQDIRPHPEPADRADGRSSVGRRVP